MCKCFFSNFVVLFSFSASTFKLKIEMKGQKLENIFPWSRITPNSLHQTYHKCGQAEIAGTVCSHQLAITNLPHKLCKTKKTNFAASDEHA